MESPEPNKSLSANRRSGAGWMAVCLAAVTLAVFWRATECDFVNYDDNDYVTDNSNVQKGLTAGSIRWAFTYNYDGIRIPLTWLSHMTDWQVHGENARGHHLTSVLLHVANTVLLFGLLRFMTGSLWRSAFAAALFALHPLHVESAAWVSERKGVLSTFFWLLTLWAYARYACLAVEGPKRTQTGCFYALALVFFACGLMTKPIVVTLPLTLLLLDYWPLERWEPSQAPRQWLRLVAEKIPFFLIAGIGSAVTFCEAPAGELSAGQRISNALIAYPRYLGKALWPADLAMPYPYLWNWPAWATVLAAAFLTAATGLALRQARQRTYWTMGWFWFLGTLAPVLGLVRMGTYSIADRYTYVSLIGIFMATSWMAGEISSRSDRWKQTVIALAGLALCLCAWRANHQIGYWQNSGTLFTRALEVTEDNVLAQNNLGYYFYKQGRLEDALKHYVEAVRISPQYNTAWENIFLAMADERLNRKVLAHYTQALKSKARIPRAPPNNWSTIGLVTLGVAIGFLSLKMIPRARGYPPD